MRSRVLLSLFLVGLLFPSCSSPASPLTPTPVSLSPAPYLASPTSSPVTPTLVTPTVSPIPSLPRPRYTLRVALDYRRKRLTVDETIVYANATGETLRDLVLAVAPNYWPSVFKLTELEVDQLPITNYQIQSQKLTIPLAAPLAPGRSVELSLAYALRLPEIDPELSTKEIRPQFFGYTDKQMNLVNWYPFLVPRVDGEWVLHDPWYFGEHLVYEAADFEMHLQNADPDVLPVIAASAYGEPNGEWTRYTLENARAFAFSASTQWRLAAANAGNVFVYSYYLPGYESPARAAAWAAADAIEIFSERFGPYPHQSLTIAMSDFNDGAEFSAFFFLSKGFYKSYDSTRANYLTFLSAHETAHQWWFEQVANDPYLEPWLDEALCAYSERLFYEQTDPPLVEWWWTHRVDAYTPRGFVDLPLATPFEGEMYRQYVDAVYLRGARFLEDLRLRIGDEAFFAFLQDYLAQMRGRIATAEDFFALLRRHTDADISDLVGEYFQEQH